MKIKSSNKRKVIVSVTLPPEINAALGECSRAQRRHKSQIVELALEQYIAAHQPQKKAA